MGLCKGKLLLHMDPDNQHWSMRGGHAMTGGPGLGNVNKQSSLAAGDPL